MNNSEKAINIKDIARLAGVSTASVSRALNDSKLIKEETKQRILEVARQHNFTINYRAQTLSKQKSNVISVFVPVFSKVASDISPIVSDPFFLKVFSGLLSETSYQGYDLVVSTYHSNKHDKIYQSVLSKKVGGVIIYGDDALNWEGEITNDQRLPIVFFGGKVSPYFYRVGFDDVKGGKLAASTLNEKGAKNLAYIGGNIEGCVAQDRKNGFVKQAKALTLDLKESNISFGSYLPQSGVDQMKALFDNDPTIDGVFACSDVLAKNAISYLQSIGKKVPEDIKVFGYDNVEISSTNSPSITTIEQDGYLMGQSLVQKVISIMDDEGETPVNEKISIKLINRESC